MSTKWQKGQSGCPGGVWSNPKLRKLREELEKLDPVMLETLKDLATDESAKVRAKAVEIWARYRIPVPKSAEASDNTAPAGPVLPAAIAARLASGRLQ